MNHISEILSTAVAAEPLSVPLALLAAYAIGFRGGVKLTSKRSFDNR